MRHSRSRRPRAKAGKKKAKAATARASYSASTAEAFEDRLLAAEARRALADDPERIPYEQVRRDLGLD